MDRPNLRIGLLLAIPLLLSACADTMTGELMGAKAPAKHVRGMWTGANGMTLYTFDKDVADSGISSCNDACASNWPPFLVSDKDYPGGQWTIITRKDGKRQWAYLGKPLYYWSKDQKAGDATGDGVNQVWHIAR